MTKFQSKLANLQQVNSPNSQDNFQIKLCCAEIYLKFVVPRLCEISETLTVGHFTVVCLGTKPLSGSEAQVDLVLVQTLLLLICKSFSCYAD